MNKNETISLLPFRFKKIDNHDTLLVNDVGDYYFLDNESFKNLLDNRLCKASQKYQDLISRHFVSTGDLKLDIELLATKYRTKKAFLNNFTSLHMMVITLRCNHKCRYCQVSSEEDDAIKYDMTPETAKKITEYIFQSPSPHVKIEFQGGEPLLNWSVIESTVLYAKKLNKYYNKHLTFVICTNLTIINESHLIFCKEHNILLSTSLDGPNLIHDKNRLMRNNEMSFQLFTDKLKISKKILGKENISALMTTTSDNLQYYKEIVDEYLKLGFHSIFFRSLNPYGDASINAPNLGYSMDDFTASYEEGLNYIIQLNLNGVFFIEGFTALLLRRILTPFATGFVDLQSPSGAGISGVIYDYNGDVYPADEARMLARMGDDFFLLGNVYKDKYSMIFNSEKLRNITRYSCIESLSICTDCVYQSYCGGDPIRNYLETHSLEGDRISSDFCNKHFKIFEIIFKKIRKNDKKEMDVFWSWLTNRSLAEVKNV